MPTFRDMHIPGQAFVIPNPWDVGSARMLAALGFGALATTSAGMAYGLGRPEGTVSPDDTLAHCRALVKATPLPVSADLENGFGDSPDSVADAIVRVAATGVAGASIEDHTGSAADPIYDFDLAVDRIAAAVQAARGLDRDFVLTARCENLLHGRRDLDDTLRRLQAYEQAGADVLYAPGLPDLDTMRQVCSAVKQPVNILFTTPGRGITVDDISGTGAARISVGSAFARVAFGAMLAAARELGGPGTFDFGAGAASFKEIEDLLGPQ